MRFAVVLGTRPDVIKAAPLLAEFEQAGIEASVWFTGPADVGGAGRGARFYGVDIPEPSRCMQSSTQETPTAGAVMSWVERILASDQPGAMLVVGDSATATGAALAAARAGVPVVHVDAGLRSGDLRDLDEVDRIVISRVAALHLTPTEQALEHLEDEGIEPERIHFVGASMAEAALRTLDTISQRPSDDVVGMEPKSYIVASFRRADNVRDRARLRALAAGLGRAGLPVVMPDPGVFLRACAREGIAEPATIIAKEMLPYAQMLTVMRDAAAVITDCGEIAEEACILCLPCLTVRPRTEHQATLANGANRLVDADETAITQALEHAVAARHNWVLPKRWDRAVSDRVARIVRRGVVPLS